MPTSTDPTGGRRTRYALVGTGSRARSYLRALVLDHPDMTELVALLDPNPTRLDFHLESLRELGVAEEQLPARYAGGEIERMISERSVERVIVTSPDHTHADVVARVLLAGADVIVEKPLTIDAEGTRRITEAMATSGREVVVTFNYRYSPRNSALRELIASGALGHVTSVQFEWVLDTAHGADYFRRWHRDKANSGGLLVHKASHHFDLVNWWIDDVPRRVYASGGLRFYGAENAARDGRGERPARGTGAPGAGTDPFLLDLRADDVNRRLYLEAEQHDGYLRDQDVFTEGITIEDNLSLVVDYAGGASMSYALNAHSPWEGYRVAINGTAGRAELEVVERSAVLTEASRPVVVDPSATGDAAATEGARPAVERLLFQPHWEVAREVPIPKGTGGHGGGDAALGRALFRGVSDDPLGRAANVVDGLHAVSVGIAGNRSLATGLPVLVADLDLGSAPG
jgi:hypothetical protein